jgi:hypothetical protein
VNHSSEFLHHLCGQLPQKDDVNISSEYFFYDYVIYLSVLKQLMNQSMNLSHLFDH